MIVINYIKLLRQSIVMSYQKGYRAEREMVHTLSDKGYMVLRAPRSGRIGLDSPDVVAVKKHDEKNDVLAIECKFRKKAFKVEEGQLSELKQWEIKAGARCFVAWKQAYKGWTFFNIKDVLENNGNIGKRFAKKKGIDMEMALNGRMG